MRKNEKKKKKKVVNLLNCFSFSFIVWGFIPDYWYKF